MFDLFTDEAKRAVVVAQELARDQGAAKIDDLHLALACLHAPAAAVAAAATDVDLDRLRSALQSPAGSSTSTGHLAFRRVVKKALANALTEMDDLGQSSISSAHVLLGVMATKRSHAARALEAVGLTLDSLRTAVSGMPVMDHRRSFEESVTEVVNWPSTEPGLRDELLEQLAMATLAEGDLHRARAFIARIDSDVRRAVPSVVLGDVTGSVDIVIKHAATASQQPGLAPGSMLSRRAVAHAYRGDADAAREDIRSAVAAAPSDVSIRLAAAEAELMLDDLDAAQAHLDAVGPVAADSQLMLGAGHLMVSARLTDPPPGEEVDRRLLAMRTALGDGLAESLQRLEIDIALAELARRRGEHEAATVLAERAQRSAEDAGFRGLALDAMVVLAHTQHGLEEEDWPATVERAAALASELGRTVIADQLRRLE